MSRRSRNRPLLFINGAKETHDQFKCVGGQIDICSLRYENGTYACMGGRSGNRCPRRQRRDGEARLREAELPIYKVGDVKKTLSMLALENEPCTAIRIMPFIGRRKFCFLLNDKILFFKF